MKKSIKNPYSIFGPLGLKSVLLGTTLCITQACGSQALDQRTVEGKTQDASANPPPQNVENVVTGFETVEDLPTTTESEDKIQERTLGLIPLDQMDTSLPPLEIDDSSMLLAEADSAENTREVIDLRSHDTGIRDQGSRGWCTAFATVAAIENLSNHYYGQSWDLSEAHHFKSYNQYQTPPSLRTASQIGIVEETTWPYYGSPSADYKQKIRAKLVKNQETSLTLSEVIASMRSGYPVIINLMVNSSFMRPKEGGIIQAGGGSIGGHAITITSVVIDQRVAGGGYFVIKNSWGSSWGDKGYGYVPFDYCRRSYCAAWNAQDIIVFDNNGQPLEKLQDGSQPKPVPTPEPSPSPAPSPNPPAPTPEPSGSIEEKDFTLKASVSNNRGLFGNYKFYLSLAARPEALAQIKSIKYRTKGDRGYMVYNNAPDGTKVEATSLTSGTYKTSSRGWTTDSTTVTLRNGKELQIPGVVVE